MRSKLVSAGALLTLACLATPSVSHGEQAVVIHWRTTYDSTSPYLFKDSDGNALEQGTAANQDGYLAVLGYFTESSSSSLFQGDFVPLTPGTTIGDSSYGSGFAPGMLSFTTKFVIGSQTVVVYPGEPAEYDVNASHVIASTAPSTNTLLAIRYYDQNVITNSAKYNTVASPDWKWPGTSSGIPSNIYFIAYGDSGSGNTSTTHYIFGNTFENPTTPYQAVIPFYFDLILESQGPGTVGPVDANGTYEYGTNQQITATVTDSHYEFSGWSGSGVADSNASITTVSMTEDRNITAVFEPKDYTLTVLVDDSSKGSATGGGTFSYGTVPTITATAAVGYRFSSWSGSGVVDSNSSSTTVTLDQDLTVTANFELKQYDLEVNVSEGGTVATTSGPYYHFGVYDLNATPAVGYDFTQWTGDVDDLADVNDSTTTITMDSNANVTAEFTEKSYLLTVSSTTGGDANGSGTYLHSQVFSITATPSVGYKFTGWSGDVGSLGDANASTTTVNMSIAGAALSITANFELKEYTLTVSVNEGGDANGTGVYKHFDQVQVTATPLSGWSFSHWSGNVSALSSDQNASTTVDIAGNTSITANFSRNQYTLTVLAGTGGDANGSGTYYYESNATLTASANPPEGYVFSNWSGDVSTASDVNASSTIIQIPASDVTVTANFSILSYAVTLTVEGDVNGTVGFLGDANGSLSTSVTYDYNDNVSTLAFPNGPDAGSPARGYYLDHWTWNTSSANGTTSENPYSFILVGDFNATANFFPIPPDSYRVTLFKNVSVAGSLYVASGGYYDEDTSFPITATVADGYTFLSWTSSEIDSFAPGDFNSTATVTLDENSTATANFLQNQYFLEVTTTSDGNVTGDGSFYAYGDSADANATPDSIHDFDQWVVGKTIDYSVGVGAKSHDENASVYLVKGQERPTLTFIRGFTYSFEVNGSEPFYFSTDQNGGGDYAGEFTSGVTNSRASGGATISITVDDSTPDFLHYYSGLTAGMGSPIKVLTKTDAEIVPFPTQASTSISLEFDVSLQATYKLKTYELTLAGGTGGTAEANATGPHQHGTTVTITAIPSEGYDFLSWSGDEVGDDASATTTISMTEAQSVTANFKIKSYTLTLASDSSGGSVRTSDNEYIYEHGTNANILATPSQGYSFVQWTGDSTSSERNTTVLMDANKSVTGTFQGNVHNLSFTQITRNADDSINADNDLGGSISAGTSFSHGSIANILATANPGYEFVEWDTNGTIDLEVTVANGVFAFKSQSRPTLILVRGSLYNFNLDGITTSIHPFYFSSIDDGGGTLSGLYSTGVTNSNATSGTVSFSPDASTPDTLYYYSGSAAGMGNQIHVIDASSIDLGQFSSTTASTNVTMIADRSYQAVFKRKSYVVTYATYPETAGSISFDSYDGSSAVEHGTSITSTATAAEDYVFVSWSGEGLFPVQQIQPTLVLSVTSAQTITANFAKEGEITLTLAVSPEGTGSVAGTGIYTYNPALPIYATANDGYVFVGWQGGDGYVQDLNSSTTTVSLIEDLSLTALFELVPSTVNEPKARPMDSVYSGWDWWQSDWFDNYWYIFGKNWIFHESLCWTFMVVQSEESVWIWIEFLDGWFWTNQTLYPFIYDYSNSEWIWFNREESTREEGNRLFYRYSTSAWENR